MGDIDPYACSLANCTALFNYSQLALQCPPDRAFVNAQGRCTCRAGWRVGTAMQGEDTCIPCSAGSFSQLLDAPFCQDCPAGRWSRQASSDCEPCIGDSYTSQPGSSTCLPCPTGSSTRLAGARDVDFFETQGATRCFCLLGQQEVRIGSGANETMSCRPCPTGAECTSEQGVARAAPEHWHDSLETGAFFPCPAGFCCPSQSGGNSSTGCLDTDTNRCAPHREGFLCGVCQEGYSSISGRECVECPRANWPVLLALLGAALLFLLVCLLENPSEDASTKLIVDYVQMCVLILNPRLGVDQILSIVHIEFGGAATQLNACIAPLPPLLGVSASALAPLGLFILLALIHLLHWMIAHPRCLCARSCGKCTTSWQVFYRRNRWRYTSAAWEVVLFGFMAITSACVQLLDCRHIGLRYVVALAPSEDCFTGAHFISAVIALIALCVLTFAVPVWLVAHLAQLSKSTQRRSSAFLHSMKQIKAIKAEYERQKQKLHEAARVQAAKKGASPAVAAAASEAAVNQKLLDLDSYLTRQMEPTRRVKRTGHEIVLWCYSTSYYWSEAWFLLRRVLFTLVTVLLDRETAAMLVIWFCCVNLVAHARFPVFRKRSSSYYHDVCLGAIAFQAALNLSVFARDPQGHVDLSDEAIRAQVGVVYAVALLPIVVGSTLFIKELLKERIRKKHTIMHKEEDDAHDERDETAAKEEQKGGGPKTGAGAAGGSTKGKAISPSLRGIGASTNKLNGSSPTFTPRTGLGATRPAGSPLARTGVGLRPPGFQLGARASTIAGTGAATPAVPVAAAATAPVAAPAVIPADSGALAAAPAPTAVPASNPFRPQRLRLMQSGVTTAPAPLSSPSSSGLPSPSPLSSPHPLSPSLRSFGARSRPPLLSPSERNSSALVLDDVELATMNSPAPSATFPSARPGFARARTFTAVSSSPSGASPVPAAAAASGMPASPDRQRSSLPRPFNHVPINLEAVMATLGGESDSMRPASSPAAELPSPPGAPASPEDAAANVIAAPARRGGTPFMRSPSARSVNQ